MKFKIILFNTVVFLLILASHIYGNIIPGEYIFSRDIYANKKIIGQEIKSVEIFKKNNKYTIDFYITRTINSRILKAKVEAKINSNSELEFNFKDGWGNKSKGKFYEKDNRFFLLIEIEKESDTASEISSYYGTHEFQIADSTLKLMNVKGEKYYKQKKYSDAIVIFNKILSYNPKNIRALGNLSVALLKLRNYKEAENKARPVS